MLKQQFSDEVCWFEEFDSQDLASLLRKPVRWLRITGCRVSQIPALDYQSNAHLYIQNSRCLNSLCLDGATSVELESCYALTACSFIKTEHIVQMKLRNLTKLESLSFLSGNKRLKAIWVERRPESLHEVAEVLAIPTLRLLWLSPFDGRSMKTMSALHPNIWMCNGIHAFYGGEKFADLAAFYDSGRDLGLYELSKRPAADLT
jgi:hypothetical protein